MATMLRIIGDQQAVLEISTLSGSDDLEIGDPQPAEALSDAADGVIGPQEIQYALQIVTVAVGTATSAAMLVSKLIDIKRKLDAGRSVRIVDRRGRTRLRIKADTGDDEIRRLQADIE